MLESKYDGSTIDENKIGLARELARMNLPFNTIPNGIGNRLLNLMNLRLELIITHNLKFELTQISC